MKTFKIFFFNLQRKKKDVIYKIAVIKNVNEAHKSLYTELYK